MSTFSDCSRNYKYVSKCLLSVVTIAIYCFAFVHDQTVRNEMLCYHVDNRSSEDLCSTEARASWPVYTDFSLGAGQSERRRLSDTSVVLRTPVWTCACFSTDVDGHFSFDAVTSLTADVSRDVSGDVRRSLLGRIVDFRIPPHTELNTERTIINNRMN